MVKYLIVPEGYFKDLPNRSEMVRGMDYVIEYNNHFFWYTKNRKTGYTGIGYYITDLPHHIRNITKVVEGLS